MDNRKKVGLIAAIVTIVGVLIAVMVGNLQQAAEEVRQSEEEVRLAQQEVDAAWEECLQVATEAECQAIVDSVN
jgi:hypothetical protein